MPNPSAIAWYASQAETALEDLQKRVQAVRSRAGQLAGFAGAVVALVGRIADRIVGTPFRKHLVFDISGREVANYLTPRFTHEPELWRVQVRTIRAVLISTDATTKAGDKAVATLRWAGLFFLGGLLSVAAALAIFIAEVMF